MYWIIRLWNWYIRWLFHRCFSVEFTDARHGEGANLPVSYLQRSLYLKYMYVYFQDVFDLLNKQTWMINILWGEIRSSGEEVITHMCVFGCVEGMLTVFYSPQAPMKRVWNPLNPKLIQENSVSLCVKGRSSFKSWLNQPWVLTVGKNKYQSITWCRCQFSMLFIFKVGQVRTVEVRGEWLS